MSAAVAAKPGDSVKTDVVAGPTRVVVGSKGAKVAAAAAPAPAAAAPAASPGGTKKAAAAAASDDSRKSFASVGVSQRKK